jgi:YceI-like domain
MRNSPFTFRFPSAAVFFLLFILIQPATGQNFNLSQVSFETEDTSVISILGNSTVGAFTCESTGATGSGRAGLEHETTGESFVEASLLSPVAAFDCKNGKITSDLQKALKKDEYPQVALAIDAGFARPSNEDEAGEFVIRVAGTLTIAGIDQPIDMTFNAVRESFFTFRLKGIHSILMSDFGISPPSALLGLIKTNDQITIDFDLVLSPTL